MITFAEAQAIVRTAEGADWTLGTYQIEDEGFEDATHYLVGPWCRSGHHPWPTATCQQGDWGD
jgi:hypothetical protein